MSSLDKPLIMTVGDPSGVGPELTIEAFRQLGQSNPFVAIGDLPQLQRLGEKVSVIVQEVDDMSQWNSGALCVLRQEFSSPPKLGETQLENAAGTIEMIRRATSQVKTGKASAIVTNPINKMVLQRGADFQHPGHTEFLAELDGSDLSVMMLVSPELRVVPVTIHIPLKDVPVALTEDLLVDSIRILDQSLKVDCGLVNPRIAVAGLNPHAGENGQMGTEELTLLEPVLETLRRDGINLIGPMSADTMFHSTARKGYDAALCMYHDQALIPIKTIDFDRGVNTTLGLSFIRTSPDHGTAYDIAGKGMANPSSLIEAIKLAGEMATNRSNYVG